MTLLDGLPAALDWTLLFTFDDLADDRAVCHAVEAFDDTDEDMLMEQWKQHDPVEQRRQIHRELYPAHQITGPGQRVDEMEDIQASWSKGKKVLPLRYLSDAEHKILDHRRHVSVICYTP